MAIEEPHALLRYVTPPMQDLFSPLQKAVMFRKLWVAIMQGQKDLGLDIPTKAIDRYAALANAKAIDLNEIEKAEIKKKHDVAAHLAVFQEQAGYEFAHQACTSRDITDNVELMQLRDGIKIIHGKVGRALLYFVHHAKEWIDLPIAERTHNVPAQISTLGRRFAMYGEPLIYDFKALGEYVDNIPFRGVLGPITTGTDQLKLLGSSQKVESLNESLTEKLGFKTRLISSGQIFPRSIEANGLAAVASATNHAANYAKMVRLCTGYEQLTEGFDPQRVGSSAMPHKMNASRAERICSLAIAMRGYSAMLQEVAGDQWFAGDVSDSAARRLAVHDGLYTADGIFNTTLQILNDTTVFEGMFARELQVYGPYLASTGILVGLQHPPQGAGIALGREKAHELVKGYAVGSIMNYRRGGEHTFLEQLANDPSCPLFRAQLDEIVASAPSSIGLAKTQAEAFAQSATNATSPYTHIRSIQPVKTV